MVEWSRIISWCRVSSASYLEISYLLKKINDWKPYILTWYDSFNFIPDVVSDLYYIRWVSYNKSLTYQIKDQYQYDTSSILQSESPTFLRMFSWSGWWGWWVGHKRKGDTYVYIKNVYIRIYYIYFTYIIHFYIIYK